MGKNVPKEGGPEKAPEMGLAERIKQTSQERDRVTQRLFSQMAEDQNPRKFVEKACNLAQIEPPKPNEPLAGCVYRLQKFLNFPDVDKFNGRDGKLGPLTFDGLINKFPVLNPKPKQDVVGNSRKMRRKLIQNSNLPKPPKSLNQNRNFEREPVDIHGTSFFGDSLTQQYAKHILSKTDFQKYKNKDFKIGKWARTMRKQIEKNLDYYSSKKAIVIGAGTNDLDSRSANAISEDIEAMYTMLMQKNPNIQIIGLTLIPYPGNAAKNAKINSINNRIRSFANRFPRNIRVVDLHAQFTSAMNAGKKMLYGDKVHMRPKAEKAVARMIQDELNTGSHKEIKEYLS